MLPDLLRLVSSRFIAALIQLVIVSFFSSSTSLDMVGVTYTFLSLANFCSSVLDFGVPTYLNKEQSKDPYSNKVLSGLKYTLITTLLFISFGVICLTTLWRSGVLKDLLLLILLFSVSLEKLINAFTNLQIANSNSSKIMKSLTSQRLVTLLILVLILRLQLNPILAFGLSSFIGNLVALMIIRDPKIRFRYVLNRKYRFFLLKEYKHFGFSSVSAQLRNLDISLVSAIAGTSAGGIYSISSKLLSPALLLPTAFGQLTLAKVSKAQLSNNIKIKSQILYIHAIMLILVVILYFSLPAYLKFLGLTSNELIICLNIMLVSTFFAVPGIVMTSILQGLNYQAQVGKIALLSNSVGISIVAIGSHLAGSIGGAIGTLLGFSLYSKLISILALNKLRAKK